MGSFAGKFFTVNCSNAFRNLMHSILDMVLSFCNTQSFFRGLQEMLEENEKVLTELHAKVNQVGDEVCFC